MKENNTLLIVAVVFTVFFMAGFSPVSSFIAAIVAGYFFTGDETNEQ